MKTIKILLLSITFLFTISTSGYSYSGNELENTCMSELEADQALCLGYIMGVLDMQKTLGIVLENHTQKVYFKYCGLHRYGQIIKVVKKYLRDHPEDLHVPADILTLEAMVKAFPCSTNKQAE
jgi:hypothetical protein